LAFTKERKNGIVAQYKNWVNQSQAVFILEYSKMNMKAVDVARAKVRDAGGELHVVKNTLFKIVIKEAGMPKSKTLFEGSSLVGFAFNDAPAMAKVMAEVTKNSEVFKVKGGYLGKQMLNPSQVKALADLPPLSVMRARVLGVLLAPASQLVRTLAEPARSLAGVFKAYSEKETLPEAS
jgi:large subunit ribosomal protein L10